MSRVYGGAVDGVPTFWVESGRPTLTAHLMFRAGMVDETLPTSGWIHLLEHLALHGMEQGALTVNGSVSLTTTDLVFHGPADQVCAALATVTRWLAEPELSRLEDEKRVLLAESQWRGPDWSHPARGAMLQRFGSVGPGLSGYNEAGLSRATPDGLRRLSEMAFSAGNAVLTLDGPPPSTLTLALRQGPRLPMPRAVETREARPAAYVIPSGVVMSGRTERTTAATFVQPILLRTLTADLRETELGAYAPWSAYEPVDDRFAVLVAGSDVADSLRPRLIPVVRDSLQRLRAQPPSSADLSAIADQGEQHFRDPYSVGGLATRAGHFHLRGRPHQQLDEIVAELRDVTPDHVAHHIHQFAASLLLGIPGDSEFNDELPMLTRPTSRLLGGEHFRSRNRPLSREVLTIGPTGISIGDPTEPVLTGLVAQFPSITGIFAYPDGARSLVLSDGWTLDVEPTLWRNGPRPCSSSTALFRTAC